MIPLDTTDILWFEILVDLNHEGYTIKVFSIQEAKIIIF
jgi:hypothetical protein